MKVFIINLKRAEDRREFMKKQIDSFDSSGVGNEGLEFAFFDAIDAKNGEQDRFKERYRSFLTKLYRAKDYTEGEKACYASHFSLWQRCVELDEPIVVLEDDIELLPSFSDGVKRIFDSSYEYVRLMGLDMSSADFTQLDDDFHLSYGDVQGSQGYYLTPKAAKKFIKGSKYWIFPVDNFMDRIFLHGVKTILYMPFLVRENEQMASNTTIPHRHDKNNVKRPILYRIAREIFRLYNQARKKIYIFMDKRFF